MGIYNASDSATCLTTWPFMEMLNQRLFFWQISTQIAVGTWLLSFLISHYLCIYVYWCTGRLSLTELYDNGDLNLVLKKIIKNMRQISYREVVFVRFWYFIYVTRRLWKTVGSTVVNTWWKLTFLRVTEEEHDKNQCGRGPILVSPCSLTFAGIWL